MQAAIFASGEGSNAINLIRHFDDSKTLRISLVFCNNPDAPVIEKARELNRKVQIINRETLSAKSHLILEFLKVEKISLLILAGFLLKIPTTFINAFPNRIVNLHPSLLPKYGGKGMYGLQVHRAVIAGNEKVSGITIHMVNEEYDQGKILTQIPCTVHPDDSPEQLSTRVRELEHFYLPRTIEDLIAKAKNQAGF